jgi:RNA-binding protein YhbY
MKNLALSHYSLNRSNLCYWKLLYKDRLKVWAARNSPKTPENLPTTSNLLPTNNPVNPTLNDFKGSVENNLLDEKATVDTGNNPQSKESENILEEITKELENPALLKVQVHVEEGDALRDSVSNETASKIIYDLARKYACSTRTASIGIAKFIQDGGANSSKPNLVRTIDGVKFDIADLRALIKFHVEGGTVRKLAKTLRDLIARISVYNSWPGPLYKDLMRNEPTLNISSGESYYCNEIHSDNYNPLVPPRIREALQRREQKFREKTNSAVKPFKSKVKGKVKGKGKGK